MRLLEPDHLDRVSDEGSSSWTKLALVQLADYPCAINGLLLLEGPW